MKENKNTRQYENTTERMKETKKERKIVFLA